MFLFHSNSAAPPPGGAAGHDHQPWRGVGGILIITAAIAGLIATNMISVLSLALSQDAGQRISPLLVGWAPVEGLGALCGVLGFSLGAAATYFRINPMKALWAVAAASVTILALTETVRAFAALDAVARNIGFEALLVSSALVVTLGLALTLEAILLGKVIAGLWTSVSEKPADHASKPEGEVRQLPITSQAEPDGRAGDSAQ